MPRGPVSSRPTKRQKKSPTSQSSDKSPTKPKLTDLVEGDVITSSIFSQPHIVIDARSIECSAHNDIWTDWEIQVKPLDPNGQYNHQAKTKRYGAGYAPECRLPDFQIIGHRQRTYI